MQEFKFDDFLSEEEILRIGAVYVASCKKQNVEYTQKDWFTILVEFAYARYLCGLFHEVLVGNLLVSLEEGEVIFEQTTSEEKSILESDFGSIILDKEFGALETENE